ncbi:MAG: hexulose-6-phosphate synthase [Gammaproteobacteria bacterium]|nr:MAG: hexulose-6-phosphate synthase [Gammaproteobacteria bacterium]
MKRKYRKTLEQIYRRPTSGNILWSDIESLLSALGAEISERSGSRVAIVLFGEVRVFHRPHPSPTTDKGAIANIRQWLKEKEVTP